MTNPPVNSQDIVVFLLQVSMYYQLYKMAFMPAITVTIDTQIALWVVGLGSKPWQGYESN
jgi:hypothetical protein